MALVNELHKMGLTNPGCIARHPFPEYLEALEKERQCSSSSLLKSFERITQNTEDAELLFYFCSHQDEKCNTTVAAHRGVVH